MALDLYRRAWEIAADRTPFAEVGIDRVIASLSEDLEAIGGRLRHIRELADAGSMEDARVEALALLSEYWLAEILEAVELPVRVESVPSGARVFANGADSGVTTPGFVRWRPGTDLHLSFASAGFLPATEDLLAADPERGGQDLPRIRDLARVTVALRKELVWEAALSGAVEAGATVSGAQAIFATRNSVVYRISTDRQALKEIHRFECIGGIAATPAAAGERVFAASVDGEVVALSPDGGPPRWRQKRPGGVYAGLSTDGLVLLVADTTAGIAALDDATGAEQWQRRLPGEVREQPLIVGDRVFVATVNGHVLALSLRSGETCFDVVPPGFADRMVLGPAVEDGVVCVARPDGRVVGLDAGTGATIFDLSLGTPLRSAPVAAAGNFLLAGEDGGLRVLRAGRIHSTLALGSPARVLACVTGDLVLVATETGSVLALDSGADGVVPRWKVDLPLAPEGGTETVAAGAVIGESLLLATGSGRVYLLRL
jgi:outer membrane protein assembly factor BamB